MTRKVWYIPQRQSEDGNRITDNIIARRKRQTTIYKTQRRKLKIEETQTPLKPWGWLQVFRKCKQFLLDMWHPSRYSWYTPDMSYHWFVLRKRTSRRNIASNANIINSFLAKKTSTIVELSRIYQDDIIDVNITASYMYHNYKGPSLSWSYGGWIDNYLWNQCLSSLTNPAQARCTRYNIRW